MPKYQVLQPIEKKNVLYVPSSVVGPQELPSGGHGKPIPVDASGEIELTEEEARGLIYGQVPLYEGVPDPIGGAEIGKQKARKKPLPLPPKPPRRRQSTRSSWPLEQRRQRRGNSFQRSAKVPGLESGLADS